MTFAGFPSRGRATAIPDVFFTDVMPALTDGASLAVTLVAMKVLLAKKGFPRYVTASEMEREAGLAAYVEGVGLDAGAIRAGLRRAVDAGALFALTVEAGGGHDELYFLNAPSDTRGMEAVRSGSVSVGRVVEAPPAHLRSGVFALYESLIGPVSALLAEELAEAERLYPAEWLEAAFREAAAQNARSWRYVSRILERWAVEGPDHEKTGGDPAEERYLRGKYGRILKQRLGP
jgi:DNA replication protein